MLSSKTPIAIFILSLFSTAILIGCGGGETSPEPSSSEPSTSSEEEPASSSEEEPEAEMEESEPEAEPAKEEPAAEPDKPVETSEKKPTESPKKTASGDGTTGSVSGVIKLTGGIPEIAPLVKQGDTNAKDAKVCAAQDIPDEALVVNPDNQGIANVFVYMRKAPKDAPKVEVSQEPILFDQKGCKFIPHALIFQSGQTIKAVSSDDVPHNLHTYPVKNSPVNQIISPNDKEGLMLEYNDSEVVPVKVACDIHPWMQAWHFPLDHPYGAVTNETGEFLIENLPPGEHEFRIWQESSGYLEKKLTVTVKAGEVTELSLEYAADKFELE